MKVISILLVVPMMVLSAIHINMITMKPGIDESSTRKHLKRNVISVNDLYFYYGDRRIAILSLSRANFQKLLGKPKRIEKGYSEMDDDDTITYYYPDGELIYFVEHDHFYIEAKGSGWGFAVREKNGIINKFSPGNTLSMLKDKFPDSYKNPVNLIYVNLDITTSDGILSDYPLTFEVDKARNKIIRIILD